MTRRICLSVLAVIAAAPVVAQTVPEAVAVPSRILVIFNARAVPADAAARVQKAGGKLIDSLDEAGVVVAAPSTASGDTLLRNLRKDPAVLGADYDRIISAVEPAQIAAEAISPDTHLPHPYPFSSSLPADFFYTSTPQQWSVKRVGAQGGGIAGGGAGAWDVTKGAGARIAILDTGINPAHPDVSGNVVFNAALTSYDPSIWGPQNCEVPDPANPPFDLPFDQNGHGTFTSSLAAGAAGAGTGLVIGVAPEAQILNIKVLRNVAVAAGQIQPPAADTPYNRCLLRGGSGLYSWILNGILLAGRQHADVISLSLGGFVPRNSHGGDGAALWSAADRVINYVTAHGALVVAAAGNSGLDLDRIGPYVELPADSPQVIAVMATTNPDLPPPGCPEGTDCLASYSDYGTGLHGLAAPGGDSPGGSCSVTGTPCNPTGFIRGACSAGLPDTSDPVAAGYPESGPPPAGTSWGCFSFAVQHSWYVQATGTSAATPLVAGAAALVKAANPALAPAQIRTILQQTAQDIGKPGYDALFNFGLVNAAAAVTRASAQ